MTEREANGNGSKRVEEIKGKVGPAMERAFGKSQMAEVLTEGVLAGFGVLSRAMDSHQERVEAKAKQARIDAEAAAGHASNASAAAEHATSSAQELAEDARTIGSDAAAMKEDHERVAEVAGIATEIKEVLTHGGATIKETLSDVVATVRSLKATVSVVGEEGANEVTKTGGELIQHVLDEISKVSGRITRISEKVDGLQSSSQETDVETRVAKLEANLRTAKTRLAKIVAALDEEDHEEVPDETLESRVSALEKESAKLSTQIGQVVDLLVADEENHEEGDD